VWIGAISNHNTAFYLVSASSQTFHSGDACPCRKWLLPDGFRPFEAEFWNLFRGFSAGASMSLGKNFSTMFSSGPSTHQLLL
jgi:hypothetical protein